jgi:transposase
MKRELNYYSDELKMQVVQEYLSSDLSVAELMRKYSIRGNSCIIGWMRKFGFKEGPKFSRTKYNTTMSKGHKKTPLEITLEAKVKELEKALEYEKMRSLALDTMIDIAEEKLKISIRKKSGTKQ